MLLRIGHRGRLDAVDVPQDNGCDARCDPPKATSTTPPKVTKVSVGKATTFCAAFKEMQSVKASAGAAAAGAAYQTVAAEMRKYAPPAIKDAAMSYANVIDDSGKALKAGTMPTLSAKSADLAKVTVWVSKNCPLK